MLKQLGLKLGLATLLAVPTSAFASSWDIDAGHSLIGFSVKHLMISNVKGKFNKFSGTIELDDKDPTKSTVTIEVDTASIDTNDEKRDGHLQAPDFFDSAKFPKMTFKSTKIQKAGKGFKVTGDLTIKDVTKPVTLNVDALAKPVQDAFAKDKKRTATSANAVIKRKDWGLVWNMPLEGGGVIVGDDVKLELEIEAVSK